MKKLMQDLTNKSIAELEKEVAVLRYDMTKLGLDRFGNPQKDSNMVYNKGKKVAQIMTVLQMKKFEAVINSK